MKKSKKQLKNYQIDQSGKIEKTDKDTVLALSNGSWDGIIVKAKTKRQVQEIFRRNGQIRNYILFTFSAILASLIKRNNKIGQVLIDTEYMGKDAIIKNIVLEMLSGEKIIPDIHFGFVGKESPSDVKASRITHKKEAAKKELSLKEILRLIKKTEVGKQLKDT